MGWPRALAASLCSVFLLVDVAFFSATLFKIPSGGWLPLVVAAVVFTLLTTWRTGHRHRARTPAAPTRSPRADSSRASREHPPRASPGDRRLPVRRRRGSRLPCSSRAFGTTMRCTMQVLVVTVLVEERPRVHAAERTEIEDLGDGFHQVVLRFGYLQDPDVPKALAGRAAMDLGLDLGSIAVLRRPRVRAGDRRCPAWHRGVSICTR